MDAQILITKKKFNFLKQDSYINTATICEFQKKDIDLGNDICFITTALKSEIIKVTQKCQYHSPANKELIKKNFMTTD